MDQRPVGADLDHGLVLDVVVPGFAAERDTPGPVQRRDQVVVETGGQPHLVRPEREIPVPCGLERDEPVRGHEIPQPVRTLVQDSYGQAIAEVFLSAAPFALLAFLITLFIRETVLRQSTSDIAAEQAAEPLHEQVWNTPDDHVEHEHGPRIREF